VTIPLTAPRAHRTVSLPCSRVSSPREFAWQRTVATVSQAVWTMRSAAGFAWRGVAAAGALSRRLHCAGVCRLPVYQHFDWPMVARSARPLSLLNPTPVASGPRRVVRHTVRINTVRTHRPDAAGRGAEPEVATARDDDAAALAS
jgi:hypothetical protein